MSLILVSIEKTSNFEFRIIAFTSYKINIVSYLPLNIVDKIPNANFLRCTLIFESLILRDNH